MGNRFPNLKNSEQYHRLIDSIQQCEADIQGKRQWYNASVKEYNPACLSIPTVFVARAIGFSMKSFNTDDGERLQQLLSSAGGNIAGATRVIASHAMQTGKMLADKAKERVADKSAPAHFCTVGGGVPQGPASLLHIRGQAAAGAFDGAVLVAAVGSSDWRPLAEVVQPADVLPVV